MDMQDEKKMEMDVSKPRVTYQTSLARANTTVSGSELSLIKTPNPFSPEMSSALTSDMSEGLMARMAYGLEMEGKAMASSVEETKEKTTEDQMAELQTLMKSKDLPCRRNDLFGLFFVKWGGLPAYRLTVPKRIHETIQLKEMEEIAHALGISVVPAYHCMDISWVLVFYRPDKVDRKHIDILTDANSLPDTEINLDIKQKCRWAVDMLTGRITPSEHAVTMKDKRTVNPTRELKRHVSYYLNWRINGSSFIFEFVRNNTNDDDKTWMSSILNKIQTKYNNMILCLPEDMVGKIRISTKMEKRVVEHKMLLSMSNMDKNPKSKNKKRLRPFARTGENPIAVDRLRQVRNGVANLSLKE